MFRVGEWAFPCCRTKHSLGSRSMDWTFLQGPTLWGHVQSERVGFPLLLNKALLGVKNDTIDVSVRWTL